MTATASDPPVSPDCCAPPGQPPQTRRRARRRRSTRNRQSLTVEQLHDTWAAYYADRGDIRLRNRLVEHYRPWIRHMAASIAHRMGLCDKDNAVGEAMAALVSSIVPAYDGKHDFDRWARICIRSTLIDQWRKERRTVFMSHVPPGSSTVASFEIVPDRDQPGCDVKFLELAAELTDQQAAVLWLRHYRGMSITEIAAMLKLSPSRVAGVSHAAVTALRKTWSGRMRDELPAY